jgi:Flp pilus assembly protein TadG
MTLRFKKNLRSRGGNAMIEFALSAAVLIPLFLGTFQFGYAFYVYNLLCTQTRSAARYASMKTFKCQGSAISDYKQSVRNIVRFGNADGSGALIEPQLADTELDIQIKDATGADASATRAPSYVVVTTVNYRLDAVVARFNFNGKPMARFPYVGRWAPAE